MTDAVGPSSFLSLLFCLFREDHPPLERTESILILYSVLPSNLLTHNTAHSTQGKPQKYF